MSPDASSFGGRITLTPGTIRRIKVAATVTGLLGFIVALAIPFLPVKQATASMTWPQGQVNSVAAPLASFVPIDATFAIPCSAASQLPESGGNLLSTIPTGGSDAQARGLFVSATKDSITATNRNVVLLSIPRSAQKTPGCTISMSFTGTATTATVTGLPDSTPGQLTFNVADPNLRPQIVGIYTELPTTTSAAGLSAHATIDTRLVTTPTTLKFAAIIIGIILTVLSLVSLGLLDCRDGRRHRRFLPAGWWTVRPLDLLVIVVLAMWWFMGGNTSDDGYTLTVGRVTDEAGYPDNYYRYFGVPQDPFGWHNQVVRAMTHVTDATPWMRLIPFVLGLLGWWIISREVVPRLGKAVRNSAPAVWTAAAVYLAIWLPFNNGLRVEPFLAIGSLITWCAVERTISTGRLLPLAGAIIAAAFTLAVAPGGLMALAALVAGARPVVKRLVYRVRRDGLLPVFAPLLAAGLAVLYQIFADTTLAAVITGSKVAGNVGPALEWWQEPIRYYYLLLPNTVDASLARRFGILMMFLLLAFVIFVMLRRKSPRGIPRGPIWRLVAVVLGTTFITAFTPTKWTHQLGIYAGIAAGVAAVAGAMAAPAILRSRRNRTFLIAAALFVAAVAVAGVNGWWYVGNYGVPWNDRPPALGGISAYWVVLIIAIIIALWGLWQHFRDDYRRDGAATGTPRFAGVALPAIIMVVVLFEIATTAKGAVAQRHSFSWASSNARALTGNICSLANDVLVEKDPNAGLLTAAAVAGQNQLSPGAALAGGKSPGFTANGLPTDLSIDTTKNSDSDSSAQNTAQNSAGSDDTGGDESTEGGTAGGVGVAGINGSTARLPFGLSPAKTPVLGSYGGGGDLTSGWYQMPARSAGAPLLVVSAAGAVQAIDGHGIEHSGQQLRVEYGRVGAGGRVAPVGERSPIDVGEAPTWRNLRFPLADAPGDATVVRLRVADTSSAGDQWVAVTPPRISTLSTLEDVVGRTDPVLIDWVTALAFPCQKPMGVKYGVEQVPLWRILPDAEATRRNSQTWMSGSAGGPLGLTEAMLKPQLLPTYLRNDWGNDWGSLQRFTAISPAPRAKLDIGSATRNGLWNPAPMRDIGY